MNPLNDPFGSAQRTFQEWQRRQDLINKAIGVFHTSPAQGLLEAWQRQQDLIHSARGALANLSTQRALLDWQRQIDVTRLVSDVFQNAATQRALQDWQRQQDIINKSVDQFDSARGVFQNWQKRLESFNLVGNAAFPQAAGRWHEVFTIAGGGLEDIYGPGLIGRAAAAAAGLYNPAFASTLSELREASFLVDALATTAEIESDPDVADLESALGRISASFTAHFARAKSWIEQQSLLVVLTLIFSLLSLYYQKASYENDLQGGAAQEAATRALGKSFDEFGRKLNRLTETLNVDRSSEGGQQQRRLVVSARAANIRAEPNRASRKVAELRLGDIAEVLESQGEWGLIRYYDVLSGQIQIGWIYVRLTRRAN
jgi:SH3 domain-containing protein